MSTTTTISKEQDILSLLDNQRPIAGKEIQTRALAAFHQSKFPTRKDEQWKNTDLHPVWRHTYKKASSKQVEASIIAPHLLPDLQAHTLVFVNGYFSSELSDLGTIPENVIITSVANALENKMSIADLLYNSTDIHAQNIFAALNTACATDGVFVSIAKNSAVELPIQLLYINTADQPMFVQPHNLVFAGRNSQATLIQTYVSTAGTVALTNTATEFIVDEGAQVECNLLQAENNESFQINNTKIIQKRDSVFTQNTFTLSGALVRNNVHAVLNGSQITSNLNGLYLPKGKQHFDNFTYLHHQQPHCNSNQLYKGVMAEEGHGVFLGKILVEKEAQQTDAYQSSKNILLSDTAKVNSKPQLEIYADDVKCSHGSTTGQLDPNAMYYLRSRGLSKEQAQAMLLYAFAADVVGNVSIPELQSKIDAILAEQFAY